MSTFKLSIHPSSFNENSLLINSKDFSFLTLNENAILEISPTDGSWNTLLLQATPVSNEKMQKGCISIEQSIASTFQLKQYMEVSVKVIENIKDVALDSVELTFKDQYFARSDMWRLKNRLIHMCLYQEKKLEFFGMRCQVFELYLQGDKAASGVVTEDTKIVYRSASSMVYLFIQMSCEMWDFDINGDLYFEKAIDGFVPDLLSKWKKLHCNHDVTIVLFSRTFYEAQTIDEFPMDMRCCLQKDYKGRFYEDFYRVAVQNERYEDWSSTIILLKKLFNQYQDIVLKYHEKSGLKMPKAVNSTSSQGNFLEVLNMALNVFEKHYMDRSFDRTGQLSVVITPGVGFFEVDRELTIITKQRIIDNGIGSDLVCLGEQPLHAVPLFKFYNKQLPQSSPSIADDYNMPHWINLSFYSTPNRNIYTNFVPRIKLPTLLPEAAKDKERSSSQSKRSRHASQPDPTFPALFNYDEYDRQVFKTPMHSHTMRQTLSLHRPRRRKETPPTTLSFGRLHFTKSTEEISRLTSSEPPPPYTYQYSHSHAQSAAIAIPRSIPRQHSNTVPSPYQSSIEIENHFYASQRIHSQDIMELEPISKLRMIVGSDPSAESQRSKREMSRKLKALVNPFNPSQILIKLTSNRRRWTHVFPLGPTGIFMQQHHYQAIPQISASTLISVDKQFYNYDSVMQRSTLFSYEFDGEPKSSLNRRELQTSTSVTSFAVPEVRSSSSGGRAAAGSFTNDAFGFLWTHSSTEQEWTPAITTGVDWKSLVIPACLPITTDYFPDRRSLQYDYVLSDYSLNPEAVIMDNAVPRYFQNDEDIERSSLTTAEIYKELICQRLQQGFQLILISKQSTTPFPSNQVSSSPQFVSPMFKVHQNTSHMEECLLSIGRIFHRLSLEGSTITITRYRPRHPHRVIKVHYSYRFHAPDSDTYGPSNVDFTSEGLENYNWSELDHYICMRGEGEYELKESLKYWRLRMLLLPAGQPETRKIIDGSNYCDLYKEFSEEEKLKQRENFLFFLEVMNKIRRSSSGKPKIKNLPPPRRSSLGHAVLQNMVSSSMRERLGSNKVHDRPRMRSNSARMGARPDPPLVTGRISPATEADGKVVFPKTDLNISHRSESAEDNFQTDAKRFNETTPDSEIIKAMKSTQDGLIFLSKVGWSGHTFISYEAVSWVMNHVDGIMLEQQAINMLQDFIKKDLIRHVSRAKEHPFLYGFYLYYIVTSEHETLKAWDSYDLNDKDPIYLFEREWMEVALCSSGPSEIHDIYSFPSAEDMWGPPMNSEPKLEFKCCNVQIDQGAHGSRQEWGQVRYQNIYQPYEAFEIVVEWLVATGNRAADLVQSWSRKSTAYGLQLVPIPSDPFALPFSDDSDPLRGPIFIPLDLSCLIDTSVQALDEEGLLKLQEKILCKFGFVPYRNPNPCSPPQYVHISGSMFVMLPVRPKEIKIIGGQLKLQDTDISHISSPHDEYITRHFSGVKRKRLSAMNCETDTKIGFLWSWNYMITKRWKNSGTVDENFMRKVMRDFKAFCSNQESRLEDFWKYSDMSEFRQDASSLHMDS